MMRRSPEQMWWDNNAAILQRTDAVYQHAINCLYNAKIITARQRGIYHERWRKMYAKRKQNLGERPK